MRDMYTGTELFIDGTWQTPTSQATIEVVSPHTESVICHVVSAGPADVDRAVAAARAAFDDGPWPRLSAAERIKAVGRLGPSIKNVAGRWPNSSRPRSAPPITFSKHVQSRLP